MALIHGKRDNGDVFEFWKMSSIYSRETNFALLNNFVAGGNGGESLKSWNIDWEGISWGISNLKEYSKIFNKKVMNLCLIKSSN